MIIMKNSKLIFIDSDLNSREITLQVERGELNGDSNYTKVVVLVNTPFPKKEDGKAVFVNQLDPSNPTHWINPKAIDIGNGKIFKLNSHLLNLSESTQGYDTFRDGVINIDLYGGMVSKVIEGNEGESWVIGEGLIDYLDKYDSIIAGNRVYNLRKDRSTNAGTVIYTTEPLEESVSEVIFAERINLKLYNDFRTKQAVCKIASVLTEKTYYRPGLDERQRACLKLLTNKQASSILFEQKSYLESNRLLVENVSIINWLGV